MSLRVRCRGVHRWLVAFINMKDVSNLWLIPPFGASMVLVMSVHSSPLAHPKNIFFGHTLSALSGVIIYSLIGINPLILFEPVRYYSYAIFHRPQSPLMMLLP